MTPSAKITIVLIALAVVIIGAAIIHGRSLVRSHRERKELHRRRVEDEERKRLFAKSGGDWIKPFPTAGEMFDAVDKEARRRGRQLLKKDDDTKPYPPGGMA